MLAKFNRIFTWSSKQPVKASESRENTYFTFVFPEESLDRTYLVGAFVAFTCLNEDLVFAFGSPFGSPGTWTIRHIYDETGCVEIKHKDKMIYIKNFSLKPAEICFMEIQIGNFSDDKGKLCNLLMKFTISVLQPNVWKYEASIYAIPNKGDLSDGGDKTLWQIQ